MKSHIVHEESYILNEKNGLNFDSSNVKLALEEQWLLNQEEKK